MNSGRWFHDTTEGRFANPTSSDPHPTMRRTNRHPREQARASDPNGCISLRASPKPRPPTAENAPSGTWFRGRTEEGAASPESPRPASPPRRRDAAARMGDGSHLPLAQHTLSRFREREEISFWKQGAPHADALPGNVIVWRKIGRSERRSARSASAHDPGQGMFDAEREDGRFGRNNRPTTLETRKSDTTPSTTLCPSLKTHLPGTKLIVLQVKRVSCSIYVTLSPNISQRKRALKLKSFNFKSTRLLATPPSSVKWAGAMMLSMATPIPANPPPQPAPMPASLSYADGTPTPTNTSSLVKQVRSYSERVWGLRRGGVWWVRASCRSVLTDFG